MPRTNPDLYFDSGKPCPACQDTLRYRANNQCVSCVKRRNREKYLARRNREPHGRAGFPLYKLADVLARDAHNPSSIERNRHLDEVMRKKLSPSLGDQDAPKITCGGDLHRAMLHVGNPFTVTPARDADRAANEAFGAAIRALYPKLPTLVSWQDVVARLSPGLIARMGTRLELGVAKALALRGAMVREIGASNRRDVRNLYILRDFDRYAAMKRRELTALFYGKDRSPVVHSRASKARTGRNTPGRWKPAVRASNEPQKGIGRQGHRWLKPEFRPKMTVS
jgi:hypothetical protein